MLVTITLKIDFETLLELERYAERHGLTRSAVIRLAIRLLVLCYLENICGGCEKMERNF